MITKLTWVREQKCCCYGGNEEGFVGIGGEDGGGVLVGEEAHGRGCKGPGTELWLFPTTKYLLSVYYIPGSVPGTFEGLSQLRLSEQSPKVDIWWIYFTDGGKLRFREIIKQLVQGNWV